MNISETVKRLRKDKGWTQARLAMEAHVSQQAISFIERGRNEPSAEMIRTLAETFGVSVSEIMGEAGNRSDSQIRDEESLIAAFRCLNQAGRVQVIQFVDYLLTRPELKKGAGKERAI